MTLAATAPTWIEHGACRGLDPLLFHPQRGESTRDAKAVCATCAVRVECLTWALATDQKRGILGGTAERDRRRIRRRLAAGQPVPQLDPDHDASPPPRRRPVRPTPTKEPAVDLAVAATEPADVPPNGARPTDPKTGLPTDACVNCGVRYTPKRKDQRFHTKECARVWYANHPRAESGEREPRIRPELKATATPRAAAAVAPTPVPAPQVAAPPGPVEALLGQLLASCSNWHVEADLGDVHVTVSRGRQ